MCNAERSRFDWFPSAEQLLGHRRRRFGVEALHDVAVGVEGDADRAVAEAFAHDFRMYAGFEGQTGPAVAKVV